MIGGMIEKGELENKYVFFLSEYKLTYLNDLEDVLNFMAEREKNMKAVKNKDGKEDGK